MSTDELIARTALQSGLSSCLVRSVFSCLIGAVGQALRRGDPVVLDGFGRFVVAKSTAPGGLRVRFSASTEMLLLVMEPAARVAALAAMEPSVRTAIAANMRLLGESRS